MPGTRRGIDAEAKVSTDGALKAALERAEREAVEKVLAQANGDVAEAAAMLGILRTSLYRIMKRYGIASPSRARSELMAQDAGARLQTEALCFPVDARPRAAVEHPRRPRFPTSACLSRDTTMALPRPLTGAPRTANAEARRPHNTTTTARLALTHNVIVPG
jgi:hypothetical protein